MRLIVPQSSPIANTSACRGFIFEIVAAEFETQFVTAGSLLYAVEHRPWPPPDSQWPAQPDLCHFADRNKMLAWAPQRVRR